MATSTLIAATAESAGDASQFDTSSALRFITCGSVDDGKSTLIGRLLVDSNAVLRDQLAAVSQRGVQGDIDLARLTDGLSAEREQGITIDVAYRYFATPARKFIIGDAPGHAQYTRNMVTAASSAHAAVVLVDATKLDWATDSQVVLLPQTRRHSLLVNLLRVPSIVFAVNKLDTLGDDAATAFARIGQALRAFAAHAGIAVTAVIPISALKGFNVVNATPGWCGYAGPSLLGVLEALPVTGAENNGSFAFPVQWVEKPGPQATRCHPSQADDAWQGRRVFWGRVATGTVQAGDAVTVHPGGQSAKVARVMNHVRVVGNISAGHGAGIVLDREVDVSRGDWLLAPAVSPTCAQLASPGVGPRITRDVEATVAWMDDAPLVTGRMYLALHGHRWIKAKVQRIIHNLDIHTLQEQDAAELAPGAIGHIHLALQEAIPAVPYAQSRVLGSLILVDPASHQTSGALMLR